MNSSLRLSESVATLIPLGHRALSVAWANIEPSIPVSDRKNDVARRITDLCAERTAQGYRKLAGAGERKLVDEALLRLSIWLEGYEAVDPKDGTHV